MQLLIKVLIAALPDVYSEAPHSFQVLTKENTETNQSSCIRPTHNIVVLHCHKACHTLPNHSQSQYFYWLQIPK